ncbi:hypothetical protein BHE74_00027268 [Ensete ventricosum]|nr:hypothetical protein BHE74_00027268 [Ensete ventricosum]
MATAAETQALERIRNGGDSHSGGDPGRRVEPSGRAGGRRARRLGRRLAGWRGSGRGGGRCLWCQGGLLRRRPRGHGGGNRYVGGRRRGRRCGGGSGSRGRGRDGGSGGRSYGGGLDGSWARRLSCGGHKEQGKSRHEQAEAGAGGLHGGRDCQVEVEFGA